MGNRLHNTHRHTHTHTLERPLFDGILAAVTKLILLISHSHLYKQAECRVYIGIICTSICIAIKGARTPPTQFFVDGCYA